MRGWSGRAMIVGTTVGTLVVIVGCVDAGGFSCRDQADCDAPGGVCHEGSCAFPDSQCDSGLRFDRHAAMAVAGACVPDDAPGPGTCDTDPCACAAEVAVGWHHTCAVRSDGSVVCFGRNSSGELGIGATEEPIAQPQRIGLPGPAVDVHAYTGAGCAVLEDGTVWCWGSNWGGGVDPGADTSAILGPTQVPGVDGIVAARVGRGYGCGRRADDTFVCWGNNGQSQLVAEGSSPGVYPSGPHALRDFDVGNLHGCLWTDEEMRCWGGNAEGQLGVDGLTEVSVPTVVPGLAGPIRAATVGRAHSCAAAEDGTSVLCWGRNVEGQVGGGSDAVMSPTRIDFDPPTPIVAMDATKDVTCVVVEGGDAYCWGDANGADLGTAIPNLELLYPPARADVFAEVDGPIDQLAVGALHACVRSAARLLCWGSDRDLQLGPDAPPPQMHLSRLDLGCDAL